MKTMVGLFSSLTEAENAVVALETDGIPRSDISMMANQAAGQKDTYATEAACAVEDRPTIVAVDATAGAAVGGSMGLLMALTGLIIPGFGPIVAAGWLVSTLAGAGIGAAAGGLIGALTGAGIPLEDAMYYREGLHQGKTLVVVRVNEDQVERVEAILSDRGATEIEARRPTFTHATGTTVVHL